jgi:hypothetical protein
MVGSTWEVRSDAGMKPLPAAVGAAGSPRKILVAGMSEVHCFQASSRLARRVIVELDPDILE